MKIVFAGTTEFGIPTLEKIKGQIILVITQPDQLAGRRKTLTPPPIKLWAEQNRIPVLQADKITNLKSQISNLNPDLLLVAAYGQIIPKEILEIPRFGSINIHGSLLPKYRGATPIQNAILNGDKITGITLIKMDEKMDHGPIITAATITINDDYDYNKLHNKLSLLAADLVEKTLPDWFDGKTRPVEQNHEQSTFTKIFTRDGARIDWTNSALQIERQIRALNPEPGTWTTFENKSVKIIEAEASSDNTIELPGKILPARRSFSEGGETNNELSVKCQTRALKIIRLQPEGKKVMSGNDFLNGLKSMQNAMFI